MNNEVNVPEVLEKLPSEARAAAEQLGLADEQGLPIVSLILQEVGVAGLCAWAAYQEVLESGNVDAFDMEHVLAAALPTFERTIRSQENQRAREALEAGLGDPSEGLAEDTVDDVLRIFDEATRDPEQPALSEGVGKDRCPTCGSSNPWFTDCKDKVDAKAETGRDFPAGPPGCNNPWHESRKAASEGVGSGAEASEKDGAEASSAAGEVSTLSAAPSVQDDDWPELWIQRGDPLDAETWVIWGSAENDAVPYETDGCRRYIPAPPPQAVQGRRCGGSGVLSGSGNPYDEDPVVDCPGCPDCQPEKGGEG